MNYYIESDSLINFETGDIDDGLATLFSDLNTENGDQIYFIVNDPDKYKGDILDKMESKGFMPDGIMWKPSGDFIIVSRNFMCGFSKLDSLNDFMRQRW